MSNGIQGISAGVISASTIVAGSITAAQIGAVSASVQWGVVNVSGSNIAPGLSVLPDGSEAVPGAMVVGGGIQMGSTSVGSTAQGALWFDTSANRLMVRVGDEWREVSTDSGVAAPYVSPAMPAPMPEPEPPQPAKVHFRRKLDLDF